MAYAWDCAAVNYQFPAGGTPANDNIAIEMNDCKDRCTKNASCAQWSWHRTTKECEVSTLMRRAVFKKNVVSQPKLGRGACTCPAAPVTAGAFPPANRTASFALFGAEGQPLGLQCWPKNANYELMQCGVKPLRSVSSAWAGTCQGLEEQKNITDAGTCQSTCVGNQFCSTWQFTPGKGCFQGVGEGVGFDCNKPRSDYANVSAARLQHGEVRVVSSLTSHQIIGLDKVFASSDYANAANLERINHCKEVCYSNLLCNVWQFYDNDGCYIESPAFHTKNGALPYPLIVDGVVVKKTGIKILGGEFIQHYCNEPVLVATTPAALLAAAPTVAASGGMPLWLMALLFLLLCLILAVVAALCLATKKKPKQKKRALELKTPVVQAPAPLPPAAPVPQLFAPQFLPTVQTTYVSAPQVQYQPQYQPVPTVAAAPATYAAPTYQTYASAPVQTYTSAPTTYARAQGSVALMAPPQYSEVPMEPMTGGGAKLY